MFVVSCAEVCAGGGEGRFQERVISDHTLPFTNTVSSVRSLGTVYQMSVA
jgi:hypothetical protein